jgi:hypothetical protein
MGTDLPEFSPDRSAPKEIDLYYYNFNIGDYRRDTVHLSILEHGIYRQLIDTYYLNEDLLRQIWMRLCERIAFGMRMRCKHSKTY